MYAYVFSRGLHGIDHGVLTELGVAHQENLIHAWGVALDSCGPFRSLTFIFPSFWLQSQNASRSEDQSELVSRLKGLELDNKNLHKGVCGVGVHSNKFHVCFIYLYYHLKSFFLVSGG